MKPVIIVQPGESLCSERITGIVDALNEKLERERINKFWSMDFPVDDTDNSRGENVSS